MRMLMLIMLFLWCSGAYADEPDDEWPGPFISHEMDGAYKKDKPTLRLRSNDPLGAITLGIHAPLDIEDDGSGWRIGTEVPIDPRNPGAIGHIRFSW